MVIRHLGKLRFETKSKRNNRLGLFETLGPIVDDATYKRFILTHKLVTGACCCEGTSCQHLCRPLVPV